jgi:hypothetical protein
MEYYNNNGVSCLQVFFVLPKYFSSTLYGGAALRDNAASPHRNIK